MHIKVLIDLWPSQKYFGHKCAEAMASAAAAVTMPLPVKNLLEDHFLQLRYTNFRALPHIWELKPPLVKAYSSLHFYCFILDVRKQSCRTK